MPNEKRAIRSRLDFSKIPTATQIPNLIEVQRRSYERFLQMDKLPNERDDTGLQSVFVSVFPITDFRGISQLDFVDFAIGNWECKCGHLKGLHHLRTACVHCGAMVITDPFLPGDVLCQKCGTYNKNTPDFCNKCGDPVSLQLKYDQQECEERGMTFSAPLKVTVRLTIYEKDPETGNRSIKDIKEQEVFFGDIPLMTPNGTFIVNGTERVIVSQLHRSPGVFFETANNRTYFLGKIIPYRGSWVEFEYDQKNMLYVRIDRKRKFLGTIFLRALGLRSDEEILRTFYTVDRLHIADGKLEWAVPQDLKANTHLVGAKPAHAVIVNGEEIAHSGRKITPHSLKAIRTAAIDRIEVEAAELDGALTAADVVDLNTGEVVVEANVELTADRLHKVLASGATSFDVFFPERDDAGNIISNTLKRDSIRKTEEALIEIYRKLRPGDPPTLDTATALFEGMFFDPRKYDFSRVGRLKFNIKLYEGQDATGLDHRTLTPEDFYATIRYLLKLRKNIGMVDDIDHLGNRRVRAVGELMENQFRIGLVRMERAIKEKMSVYQELSTAMPHDLINAKPVMAAIREFFGSSQLSQFMDQTNPLSEITHKRRLSALGPGGLSRERAGFEVRDVHPTHYGRICPIETPEGPNIGLISSLSCFARINEYGFIESPYRKVKDSRILDYVEIVNAGESGLRVGDHIEKDEAARLNAGLKKAGKRQIDKIPFSFYLSAWEEDKHTIAQANIEFNERGEITEDLVNARRQGNFVLVNRADVDYIDVSPKQLVSVAASLVPFLEHDDANRALMGANMQRQSVPLLVAEAPLVGTGMEGVTARDSGAVILARRNGVVDSVDSQRIIVRVEGEHHPTQLSREVGSDIYTLIKFKRSNQNTCINQKPVVREGERVVKGQVIADGPCTEQGELALGRNVLVAFMPWRGYNFEDAILISERLVREDYYTSVHIEEFEIEARDTKLGPEEITRDIPNVSEHALRDLDESGVIRIGAQIGHGDILVGKVTPKGETQLTPEEKLLRAIFGEKAGDVRDASLTCPPGIEGTVVDVRIFSRKGQEKDERAKQIEGEYVAKLEKNLGDEIRILTDERLKRLDSILGRKEVLADLHDERTNKRLLTKGAILDRETIERISTKNLKRIRYADKDPRVNEQIDEIEEMTSRQIEVLRKITNEKILKLQKGDELPPGVIKLVKVYVAMKRKLSVGDKMAGRHGNKGVIARILPEEDMPYLPDGTPVEIVLNPLGVPSRMNVGQILETHLGWAAHALGLKIAGVLKSEDQMMARALEHGSQANAVRALIKDEFAGTATLRQLLEMDDATLLRVARGMERGIWFGTAVFDGAREEEIKALLASAGLPSSGKTPLFDGMTGEQFEQPVTVGYIYMLKLSHLVDDKIHARSIGPYSLITQQPLGGKAQFGGQRFGEMEVWALEAYGAAYILQELLTAKSDDVYGRTKIYEAIVKGEAAIEPGVPESFNVLIRELQSLCLDVELIKRADLIKKLPAPEAAAVAD
ncbi:MAG: DNA-directed RNA polymerase subunit beta [Terracidiphilus sp.]|jgi:DNA-directed RNA polymerase subunit beta